MGWVAAKPSPLCFYQKERASGRLEPTASGLKFFMFDCWKFAHFSKDDSYLIESRNHVSHRYSNLRGHHSMRGSIGDELAI